MSAVVSFVGNLGKDPEVKFTQGGQAVCSFSVADSVYDKTAEGNRRTVWYRVSLWGARGESMGKMLAAGSKVFVSGELDLRPWTSKDGKEGQSLEVKAHVVDFAGSRSDAGGKQTKSKDRARAPDFIDDDDLPF